MKNMIEGIKFAETEKTGGYTDAQLPEKKI